LKHGEVRWVDFDRNENDGSLTRKARPAFIMPALNSKGVFVVPFTSVEKPYNQANKFAIKLSTGDYALCDQYEKVARTDKRIQELAKIKLSEQDEVAIMLALEKCTALSVNRNLPMKSDISFETKLKIGDTVSFKEEVNGGIREITGVIASIDASISLTTDQDYVLLHVQSVVGKAKDAAYKNRTSLIRTREDLINGMMLQTQQKVEKSIDMDL
jgi:hypothetical protein